MPVKTTAYTKLLLFSASTLFNQPPMPGPYISLFFRSCLRYSAWWTSSFLRAVAALMDAIAASSSGVPRTCFIRRAMSLAPVRAVVTIRRFDIIPEYRNFAT